MICCVARDAADLLQLGGDVDDLPGHHVPGHLRGDQEVRHVSVVAALGQDLLEVLKTTCDMSA